MSTVLVTGARGFIGSRVSAHLQGRGWNIRRMIRSPLASDPGQLQTVYGDLLDEQSLANATTGVDTIIHCAALVHKQSASLDDHLRVNLEGTRSLLRHAIRNDVQQFIFLSTISVYGNSPEPHREADNPKPFTPYGIAKLRTEDLCREMAHKAGLPMAILRLSTVYGEGEPGNVNRLIKAVDKLGPIVIGSGQNAKSLTYVSNVAELCDHILTHHPRTTLTCNVSDPRPYTLFEIVETIEKMLGRGREIRLVSKGLSTAGSRLLSSALHALGKASPIAPDHVETITETSVCDVGLLRRELGFEAPILLPEGLGLTTNWYRSTGGSDRRSSH